MIRLTNDDLNDIMFCILEKVHYYRSVLKDIDNQLTIEEIERHQDTIDYYNSEIYRLLELYQKVLKIYKSK